MKPFGTPPNRPQSKPQKLNWVKPFLISGAVLGALGALGWFGYNFFYGTTPETDKPSSTSIAIKTPQDDALSAKLKARAALLQKSQNSGAISTHAIEINSTAPTPKTPVAKLTPEKQLLVNAAIQWYNALDTRPDLTVDRKIKGIYNNLARAGLTYDALDPQGKKTTAEMKALIDTKAKTVLSNEAKTFFDSVKGADNPDSETLKQIKARLQYVNNDSVVDVVVGKKPPVPNGSDENLPWDLLGDGAKRDFDAAVDRHKKVKNFGEPVGNALNGVAKVVDVIREEITPSSEEEVGAPVPQSSAPVPQ
jgi:hypothetical protein